MDGMEIRKIGLERLVAHPKNANVLAAGAMKKLRRHIERTGRYEPLVVRPHPTRAGDFELINGHHRAEVLRELGHGEAACVVWELDDAETLLLLATVNRLSGEDSAGKRLVLLEELAAAMGEGAAGLAMLLPEEEGTLERLLSREAVAPIAEAPVVGEMPEALTVFLLAAEKREVVAALRRTDRDLARAILCWARRDG